MWSVTIIQWIAIIECDTEWKNKSIPDVCTISLLTNLVLASGSALSPNDQRWQKTKTKQKQKQKAKSLPGRESNPCHFADTWTEPPMDQCLTAWANWRPVASMDNHVTRRRRTHRAPASLSPSQIQSYVHHWHQCQLYLTCAAARTLQDSRRESTDAWVLAWAPIGVMASLGHSWVILGSSSWHRLCCHSSRTQSQIAARSDSIDGQWHSHALSDTGGVGSKQMGVTQQSFLLFIFFFDPNTLKITFLTLFQRELTLAKWILSKNHVDCQCQSKKFKKRNPKSKKKIVLEPSWIEPTTSRCQLVEQKRQSSALTTRLTELECHDDHYWPR